MPIVIPTRQELESMSWRERMAWRKRLVKVDAARMDAHDYLAGGAWIEEDVAYSAIIARDILERIGYDPDAALHRFALMQAVAR